VAEACVYPGVFLVVNTASQHFFCEGHYVWRISKVPLFVQPEGTGRADTSLDLIDDKVDA